MKEYAMTDAEKLAAIEEMMNLDEGSLKAESVLVEIDGWDSLAMLSYVAFMDENFNRTVPAAEIRAFKTVQNIMDTME